MRSHALYFPGLVVAATGAAVVVLSLFFQPLRDILVRPLTFVAGGVLLALFLRMLFDPNIRQGIDAANIELRSRKPRPSSFKPMPFDRHWGLFGSRMGNRALQSIRVVCFGEFVLALLLSPHDRPDLLFLALASFAVTIMLTIIHVGLNTQAQRL
jgi:multisubunit Na+/H+ antiporter MnhB subunit